MASPLLEVENIDIYYGESQVVRNLSFRADEGRITALVGANGSGKSTILNAISNMVPLGAGEIRFMGKSSSDLKPEEIAGIGISHVPEGRRLFSRLSVLENLELGAWISTARPYMRESLERVFSLFPFLGARKKQPAGTLSGGEQQMLAIARSLMSRPRLIMLDEPSLGLAPFLVRQMFDIIEALKKEGVAILLVEQNVHQALEIADYAYTLQTGCLQSEGPAEGMLGEFSFQQAFLGMVK